MSLLADGATPSEALIVERSDLRVAYVARWMPREASSETFEVLREQTPWERPRVRVYGRWHDLPRLTAWFADDGLSYRYSGVEHAPRPWTGLLTRLRRQVEEATGEQFNAVLMNYYRHGADTVGWHSDNEPALGPEPVIATVSLGGTRRFRMRRHPSAPRGAAPAAPADRAVELTLACGSLLVMGGATQRAWQHCLPRCRRAAPRISLTFRRLQRG